MHEDLQSPEPQTPLLTSAILASKDVDHAIGCCHDAQVIAWRGGQAGHGGGSRGKASEQWCQVEDKNTEFSQWPAAEILSQLLIAIMTVQEYI
jgi:hypothetical protein